MNKLSRLYEQQDPADTPLCEIVEGTKALQEAAIDRSTNTISNVCVFFRESKNGRFYSDESIDDVVHLLSENGKAFVDHRENPRERSARELAGALKNVRRDGDKVFADFKVFPHQSEFVLGVAETAPESFGFSIDGQGEIADGQGPDGVDLVERVRRLASTDLVVFPATTQSLFEHEDEGTDTIDDLERQVAEALARLEGEGDSEEVNRLRAENEKLRTALEEAENVSGLDLGRTREELEKAEDLSGYRDDDYVRRRFRKAAREAI